MKKEYGIAIVSIFNIASYIIQANTLFPHLEEIGIWPPTLLMSGVVFLTTLALILLSGAIATRLEKRRKNWASVFWVGCAAILLPWSINSLSILLESMRGS